MRNYYKVILAGIILSLSLSGCYFLPEEEEVLAVLEVVQQTTNQYVTYKVEKGDIVNSVECLATFTPTDYESFFFSRRERLKKIYPRIGDLVKKGDILAETETDDLEYELPKKEIEIQKRVVQIEEIKKNWGKQLEEKKNQREIKKQSYLLAQEDYQLKEELFKTQMASQREVDEAKLKRDTLKSEIDDLEREVVDLEKNLSGEEWSGELKIAQLDYEAAKVEFEQMKKDIELSKLVSTMDGRVVFVNEEVKNGEEVPAFREMVRVASLQNYYLEYVGEKASLFKLGSKVTINYNGKNYEGQVALTPLSVSSEELDKYRDTIRFAFLETDEHVKNMQEIAAATVSFIRNEKKDVLVIPKKAMKTVQGRNVVYVLQNGVRIEKGIEPGLDDGNYMEVIKGLEEGEEVIIQ